jgi:hypothetical protein
VKFAKGVLGHDLWATQKTILRSLATHPRTAVKACHASGKSYVAAAAALWWVYRYPDGIVVTTAPTWTQVERVLWGEIHRALQGAKLVVGQLNQTELKLGPNNYAIGLSTDKGVRFQGFHGRVLIILDEAPGVRPDIYEAIEGIRAGGDVRVLALGNPTIASGPFYDAFTSQRDSWSTHTIGAFDTPNLAGIDLDGLLAMSPEDLGTNVRDYLTKRGWVREKHAEWGPMHPLWQSRVLGQFPTQAEDALISLDWIEHAKLSEVDLTGDEPVIVGIDVAGPGEDETVAYVREGTRVSLLGVWGQADPRGMVLAALAPYRGRNLTVNVDSIGIGYNFGLHLRDQGLNVQLGNVGESPRDKEKFVNLKAELYWSLRERFQAGDIAGISDEATAAQLLGIRYDHTARGQVRIESKDAAKKRGVKSPDRAEALMLACAPAAEWAAPVSFDVGGSKWAL